MNFSIIIYFLLLSIRIIFTLEYDDDEKQVMSNSVLPNSQYIGNLTSSIFDSLLPLNTSQTSNLYTDQTIDLQDLGITNIESNTFINYHIPVTTIILSSNFLSYLPENLFQSFSKTLSNLNLQYNQFTSLTKNKFLHYLEHLRILDLSKNQITEIFIQDFLGLERLDTLILRENQLTYLSYALFTNCRKLTTLDLSDNKISMIDSNTFHLLTHLKILLLSNNPLGQHSVTNYLMKPLKHLQYLDLENTQLETLSPFLFLSNHRLQSIKLRRNNFQAILKNNSTSTLKRTFCGARSLTEIDLVSSNIHSLDVCTYHQLPSLRRLYLMNNPLDCTCDLFYFKYGDIYRLLLTDASGVDQTNADIDMYLNRWISRPELRRHLEKAHARGDLSRLPIELSLFARCTTPNQWNGYEIDNITGIYSQCRHRWVMIDQECRNYCQIKKQMNISLTVVNSSGFVRYDFYLIGLGILIFNR